MTVHRSTVRLAAPATRTRRAVAAAALGCATAVLAPAALANQMYEPLAASVQSAMSRAVSDRAAPRLVFDDPSDGYKWLLEMSTRLQPRVPDDKHRVELLKTVQYEARRAGLDPQMVLGLMQVESGFKKYAVSTAGARGLMQVMPFWTKVIGEASHNLFDMRLNVRYGCVILRHYLDLEQGNLFRALGRYNGSLGRAEYPNLVMAAWKQWSWNPGTAPEKTAPAIAARPGAPSPALGARVDAAPAAATPVTIFITRTN